MKKVIMGIGIPGSGKTTALKPFAEKNGYVYICPDDIRAEISGNAADQSKNKEVWNEAHNRMIKALSEGETVVFDATFAKDFERKNFIKLARENGAEKIQGVFADIPYDIASERNKKRERVVPEFAMERIKIFLDTNPPSLDDEIDSLYYLDELQNLKKVEMSHENEKLSKEFDMKIK